MDTKSFTQINLALSKAKLGKMALTVWKEAIKSKVYQEKFDTVSSILLKEEFTESDIDKLRKFKRNIDNFIAAQRSRRKKLQYYEELEQQIDNLTLLIEEKEKRIKSLEAYIETLHETIMNTPNLADHQLFGFE